MMSLPQKGMEPGEADQKYCFVRTQTQDASAQPLGAIPGPGGSSGTPSQTTGPFIQLHPPPVT